MTFEWSEVCWEMAILHFITVSLFNILLHGHCQLPYLNVLGQLVYDYNVWYKCSYSYLWWYCTSTSSLVARQIRVDFKLFCIYKGDQVGEDVVMAPFKPPSVEANFTNIQYMVGGLPAPAQLT